MAGSRICMFKDINPTNHYFQPSILRRMIEGQKVFKILDFWFIDT